MQFGSSLVVDHYPLAYNPYGYYDNVPSVLKKASLGAGQKFTFFAGYRFAESWVAEAGYGLANRSRQYDAFLRRNGYDTRTEIYSPDFSYLTLGARWISPQWEGLSVRMALLVPLQRSIELQSWGSRDSTLLYQKKTLATTYNLGLMVGLQYSLKLVGPLSFLAQADVQWLTVKAKRSEVTSFQVNKVERVSELTESARVVDYMNGVAQRSLMPDQPSVGPPYRVPFSSFGLSVGLVLAFGKDPFQ